jgi:hypothetical protein
VVSKDAANGHSVFLELERLHPGIVIHVDPWLGWGRRGQMLFENFMHRNTGILTAIS